MRSTLRLASVTVVALSLAIGTIGGMVRLVQASPAASPACQLYFNTLDKFWFCQADSPCPPGSICSMIIERDPNTGEVINFYCDCIY